eukprot:TRINITY_DN3013_c0_g2_i2.p1 TRINITY_DN3013_c0_g2~~TRINITY_DN3013_c0_g2_i2.p1  ORF type:complete len:333 (+),score=77.93 TRINITY_DN3013_c0_g2_i2:155-1153(+)
MAKIGESDERWIVQNRSDGKNVGNWHWSERSVLGEVTDALTALLKDVVIPCDEASIVVSGVKKVVGDMNLVNRKGTRRFIFDTTVTLEWNGTIVVDGEEVSGKGTIEIYDVDNSHDYQYRYEMNDETSSNRVLKNLLRSNAPGVLSPKINNLLVDLTEQYTQADEGQPEESQPVENVPKPVVQNFNSTVIPASDTSSFSTTTVRQTVLFSTTPQELFETLTDPQRIMAFTGSPCTFQSVEGTDFSLLDGVVTGRTTKIVPNQKIVQKWRFKDWPEDHHSSLILKFSEERGKTKLTLLQKRVPSSDSSRTTEGWENFFWRRIRGVFGWPYTLQ